jgi:hypothetical protein
MIQVICLIICRVRSKSWGTIARYSQFPVYTSFKRCTRFTVMECVRAFFFKIQSVIS